MTKWSLDESLLVYKSVLSDCEQSWKSTNKMNKKETILIDGFAFDPACFEEEDKRTYSKQFSCGCRHKIGCSTSTNASYDYLKKNAAEKEEAANLAMEQQRFYEAAHLFSEVIGVDPDRAILWTKRCTCSIALEQFDHAVADALKAITLDKHTRVPYYKLMDCFLATGELDKVQDVLEKFKKVAPNSRTTQAVKLTKLKKLKKDIDAAFSENRLSTCFELIDEALFIAPACPEIRFQKMRCLVALKKSELIDKRPQEIRVVEMLKLYYDGSFDESMNVLRSLSFNTKSLLAFKDMLNAIIEGLQKTKKLDSQQNYVAAIDKLQSMLSIDRSNSELVKQICWLTAVAHFFDKRFVEAMTFADQSLEIEGDFHEATVLKAECYFELEKFAESLEECKKVLQSEAPAFKKEVVMQLKVKVEAAMKSQQKPKEEQSTPPKTAEEETRLPKNFKSTYSTDDVKKEKVDNSQFFASFSEEYAEPAPKRQSTTYSFSSADTKSNPKFKEFVGKPKEKSETKTYQQIQDEMRAKQKNQQGNKDFSSGLFSSAIKYYTDAIAILPKYSIFYNNRGACYMKLEEFELAAADAIRSIDLDPGNWKSYSKAINCFLLLGNINQAENYIEKLQNNIPGVESVKYDEIPKLKRLQSFGDKISHCFEENNFEDCLTNVEEALKIAKASTKYRNHKIHCLIMLERFPEADAMISQVLHKNPKHAKMFFFMGLKYYQLGELETCVEKLEMCLKINSDMKSAQELRSKAKKIWQLYQEGFESYKSGVFNDAREAFEAALKIDDASSRFRRRLLFNLGTANFRLSKFEAAKESFTEALRIEESHVKSLTRRAQCHFKLKEFEDCIVDYEEVLRLEPSEAIRQLINDAKFNIKVGKGCNAYSILGISSEPTASEVKKAFHKLSLVYHSDKNPKATAVEKKKLERKFQEIKNAYNFAISLLK